MFDVTAQFGQLQRRRGAFRFACANGCRGREWIFGVLAFGTIVLLVSVAGRDVSSDGTGQVARSVLGGGMVVVLMGIGLILVLGVAVIAGLGVLSFVTCGQMGL